MAVLNRSRDTPYWELMPLAGTQNWRRYVTISMERGYPLVLLVQAFHNARSSAQVHEEDDGTEEEGHDIQAADDEDMESTEDEVEGGEGGEGGDQRREPTG